MSNVNRESRIVSSPPRARRGEESIDRILSFESTSLQRRKSLTFVLSLLERERRNHLAADVKQIRPWSRFGMPKRPELTEGRPID